MKSPPSGYTNTKHIPRSLAGGIIRDIVLLHLLRDAQIFLVTSQLQPDSSLPWSDRTTPW
ncbi:MAG: hypothetical protein ACRENK_00770 [Gemmatimonadaceae bacterium]